MLFRLLSGKFAHHALLALAFAAFIANPSFVGWQTHGYFTVVTKDSEENHWIVLLDFRDGCGIWRDSAVLDREGFLVWREIGLL